MRIGTVREIKNHEYRVGLTPNCVAAFVAHGHSLTVERGAGEGAGFTDAEYEKAGAHLAASAAEVWNGSDAVVKVKEPLESEYGYFRPGLILFTYLHLAANAPLTRALLASKVSGMAYETIEDAVGGLPLLRPMSEIAGRMSIHEGAKYLERPFGGRGVLLAGVPGVEKAGVVIVGGGTVGRNAARIALGCGARVTILDNNVARLVELDDLFRGEVQTLFSNRANLEAAIAWADLVVGAVLTAGAAAPKLIRREHLKTMKRGAVIVDVAVDQGGCCETTHPTTHEDPVFEVDGVMHYCVANMPGAVPRTSTLALTNSTLAYGLAIADKGLCPALAADPLLALGLNTFDGACTFKAVAAATGCAYRPLAEVLARGGCGT